MVNGNVSEIIPESCKLDRTKSHVYLSDPLEKIYFMGKMDGDKFIVEYVNHDLGNMLHKILPFDHREMCLNITILIICSCLLCFF